MRAFFWPQPSDLRDAARCRAIGRRRVPMKISLRLLSVADSGG
jgi:hypothetical protein